VDRLHREERHSLQGQRLNSHLTKAAWLWLIGAGLAAASRIVEPYEHAIWLVAYLLLVGFLAQLLLVRGQSALAAPTDQLLRAQAVLWNFGVFAVPAGVLGNVRIPIAAGSLALVTALVLFWRSVRPAYRVGGAGRAAIGRGYAGLLIFMLASVIAGMLLASDVPWAG